MKRLNKYFFFLLCFASFIATAQTLIPYRAKNGWGYADSTGKMVIPPGKHSENRPLWPYGSKIVNKNGVAHFTNAAGNDVMPHFPDYYMQKRLNKTTDAYEYILKSKWNKNAESVYRSYSEVNGYQFIR